MVKIDCLWAEDTPPPLHFRMHPLKHALPSAHPSLRLSPNSLWPLPPIYTFLISLSSLFLSLPLTPHPSFIAFCSNSGVTSCRKSHGSWLEKSDLKQNQDGSQTARLFFDYVIQEHNCLSFIFTALKAMCPSSPPPILHFSPPHPLLCLP